jgi:hypothetical protein
MQAYGRSGDDTQSAAGSSAGPAIFLAKLSSIRDRLVYTARVVTVFSYRPTPQSDGASRCQPASVLGPRLRAVQEFLCAHLRDPKRLSLKGAAHIAHVSPEHFCRLFHKRVGARFMDWQGAYRALHLLACSPRSAASIRFLFVAPALCFRLPSDLRSPREPLPSANTSPCRVCRGLPPPNECALPGAPKERRADWPA